MGRTEKRAPKVRAKSRPGRKMLGSECARASDLERSQESVPDAGDGVTSDPESDVHEVPLMPDKAEIPTLMFQWWGKLNDALVMVHTVEKVAADSDMMNPKDDSYLSQVDVAAITDTAQRMWKACYELRETIGDVARRLLYEQERSKREAKEHRVAELTHRAAVSAEAS